MNIEKNEFQKNLIDILNYCLETKHDFWKISKKRSRKYKKLDKK